MDTKAVISPSIHEGMVKRHMKDDTDDAVLQGLFDGVKLARETCAKARDMTAVVLANELETPAARHKKARDASFELLARATQAVDAAMKTAEQEIASIKSKVTGPLVSKDIITETRKREYRERLAALPKERRLAILNTAIATDNDLMVGAVLSEEPWLSGADMADSDVALLRHSWAKKHHAADLDRLDRISKALEDVRRAGELTVKFIDGLTDPALIEQAEAQAKKARDALAAVKG